MLPENHQQGHHMLYLSRQYFRLKESLEKTLEQDQRQKTIINIFITHFLSLLAFWNKLYCQKIRIDEFITYFLSFIVLSKQRNKILKVNSYLKRFCKDKIATGFKNTNHWTRCYTSKTFYIKLNQEMINSNQKLWTC